MASVGRMVCGIAASAVLLLAGCSSDDGGGPAAKSGAPAKSSAAAPSAAMVAWVGKVCALDSDLQTQTSAMRVAALSLVPRKPTARQIAQMVTVARKDIEEGVAGFEKVGPAPVSGGDQVVAAYVAALKEALNKTRRAEREAKNASPSDLLVSYLPQEVAGYLERAVPKGSDLPSLVARDASLKQAFQRAKDCKGSTPLTATPSPAPTASQS